MEERLPWEEHAGFTGFHTKLMPNHIHCAIKTYDTPKGSSFQVRSNGVIGFWIGWLVLWQYPPKEGRWLLLFE